jgi:hypothetical protein
VVRFIENSFLFNKLNVSRADIPCVIGDGAGGAAKPTQPVTLHIMVNITPSNLYDSPPSIPIEDVDSPAEEATIPGRIQPSSPNHPLPQSHHQPIETGNTMPQQQEVSPTGTKNPRLVLDRANEDMKRIGLIDESDTWEGAVVKIQWVMETLGPIAEVRVIPF